MITHVVKAVFKRDLRSWFGNPVGYVFIILFVLLCAAALVFSPTFFRQNLANLDTLDYWLPSILLVFIPAITMGMWASERSNGTQELLLTLPAKDSEILLGKYLAAAGVYTVALLFTLTLAIGLSLLGSPDWGQLFCNYLGMWFLGLLAISVAMLGSLLVDNLAVSFILGAVFAGVVIFSGDLLALVSPGTGWLRNGPHGQFLEFSRGVLPFGGVLLFAGMTVTFLYLNLALLSRRLWRLGDATGMHRSIRCAAMLVGAIALTAAGVYWLPRPDGTIERIHSLSGESTRLLAGLDKASPVFVTAYVSDDVPQELVQTKRTLLNLLDRFESMSGGAVQKRVVITEPYTEAATAAQNKYNIYPSAPSADSSYEAGVFLGFVVQCRGEEVVSPFVMPGMSVEYELSRSIRVAANANRRKVGVLKTEVELYGGFDFQTFQQKPRWLICDDLQLQYKVENVDADQEYPKDLDALLVPQPSSLSQEQLDKLKTWVLAGHPTLLLEDAEPMSAPGTAATDPKGGQQRNPMMGGQPPGQKGDIAAFFGAFGVNVSLHDLVWDSSFQSFTLGRVEPELLFVGPQGMNRSDPVTANLQKLVFLFSGQVGSTDKPGWTFTPLARSLAFGEQINGTVPKLNVFQFNPFGGPKQIDPYRREHYQEKDRDIVLAARVTGPAVAPPPAADKDKKDEPKPGEVQAAANKQVKLVVVADLDAFSNMFFNLRRANQDDNLRFDNVAFILDCIDDLVGDQSLIELRNRRPKLRQLTTVMQSQEQYEKTWSIERKKAEDDARKALDAAQARLDAAVKKIDDSADLDERAKEIQKESVQQTENRKLELEKGTIENEKKLTIERARYAKNAQQRQVQTRYQISTLVFTPVPALLVGLWIFFRRRSREALIVPKNRMVSGGVQ